MTVVVWVVENTWRACVPAAAEVVRPGEDVVLVHVLPDIVPGVAWGAFAGLLGRGHRAARDPGAALERAAEESAAALLDEAFLGFGGSARPLLLRGRVERVVLAAAQGARLLVLARDTSADDATARAPSPVDHAPCAVLLVWPESSPG